MADLSIFTTIHSSDFGYCHNRNISLGHISRRNVTVLNLARICAWMSRDGCFGRDAKFRAHVMGWIIFIIFCRCEGEQIVKMCRKIQNKMAQIVVCCCFCWHLALFIHWPRSAPLYACDLISFAMCVCVCVCVCLNASKCVIEKFVNNRFNQILVHWFEL